MEKDNNNLDDTIKETIKNIEEQIELLKKEGYNVDLENEKLEKNRPDVNLSYNDERLESMLNSLQSLQKELEEENIFSQLRKSMRHLDKALEYEANIQEELKTYVSICELALNELGNGLSIMTDKMAEEIYMIIYKVLKIEILDNGHTLLDAVALNDNNRKYINELIRKDIKFLTTSTFIKPKELVNLNKAVSNAEVKTDIKERFVTLEVITAVVECYSSEDRRNLVKEKITSQKSSTQELYDYSESNIKGLESLEDTKDKVSTKKLKTTTKRKVKLVAATLSALLTISSACGITVSAIKSEKLTVSNYLESVLPVSGLGAFYALVLSAYRDKKTLKILESELLAVERSSEELDLEWQKNIRSGLYNMLELTEYRHFMSSITSFEVLTDEERALIDETLYEKMRDYFAHARRKI